MTQIKMMMKLSFLFGFHQKGSVNLIADERYNPLKSRTKEGSIK